MQRKPYSASQWLRRNDILAYINTYSAEQGRAPTYREVAHATGVPSTATVSRYIHRLIEEGALSSTYAGQRPAMPEAMPVPQRTGETERISHRLCLILADGGRVYVDCHLEKPRDVPVRLTIGGILDADELRGRVGRIVAVRPADE